MDFLFFASKYFYLFQFAHLKIHRNHSNDHLKSIKVFVPLTLYVIIHAIFANAIVDYFQVKFTSMPLEDYWFLVVYFRALCCHVVWFSIIQSLYWRIKTIPKILEIPNLSLKLKFKIIGKFYSKCEKIISSMNKFFALSFSILLLDCFALTLSSTFFGYDILMHELKKNELLLFTGSTNYSFISGLVCFLIMNSSTKFMAEKKSLLIKVNTLKFKNRNKKDKRLDKNSQLLIDQLNVAQIKLSCGLFVFNIPHIFVMISSIFSYLVVTIQFDFLSSDFINKIVGKE